MTDPLRPHFWEKPMNRMNPAEWEALCDGCGKCCLNKLEFEDTGDIEFTNLACRLLDDETCLCTQYDIRHQFVPECVRITPKTIAEVAHWMPATCAYRLRHEGKPLPDWHYLVSGNRETIHEQGMSVRGRTVPEFEVPEDEWEHYIIEDFS